jgi:hypothetical protein
MNDMIDLIPHSKKDSKLDTKNDRNVVNEVADMKVGNGPYSNYMRLGGRLETRKPHKHNTLHVQT